MHPRWPHGNAAARPRLLRPDLPRPDLPRPDLPRPDLLQPDLLQPGRLQPDLLRPRRLRPRTARRWSVAGPITVLAAAAALVTGCGHSGAPAATKAVSHPATPCGSAKTPANVPVQIQVAKGKVACADAMTIERAYTSAVAQGRAPGNGRGPVEISGWKCQAFTTPVSLKTGDVSACRRSGAEILAILPPP
jgi:hypothetical protein